MSTSQFKSLLFVPASRLDLVEFAHEREADALIIDLEDGVAEANKQEARRMLNSLLERFHSKGIKAMLRINSLESCGAEDINAIGAEYSPPLLIPKVTESSQLSAVEEHWVASGKKLSALQLLPMIECPRGLFRAEAIASATKSVCALVFGSEDFATEAGVSTEIDSLAMPAQWVALAAAVAGIPAYGIPGSLGNYQDMTLFAKVLQRAKSIGYCGSLCIHPRQSLGK